MAWGRSTPKPPPPPRSVLMTLLPLIFLLLTVLLLSYVGYTLYASYLQIRTATTNKLRAKNIDFTPDGGMRVGVKQVSTESYVDATREGLVKAWNLSEWPSYRSRFWNREAQAKDKKGGKGYGLVPRDIPAK